VIVSFVPCSCKPALAEPEPEPERGHLSVSCQHPGCDSRWWKPPHDESSVTWQVGRSGGLRHVRLRVMFCIRNGWLRNRPGRQGNGRPDRLASEAMQVRQGCR
jgi:hypothetical protein